MFVIGSLTAAIRVASHIKLALSAQRPTDEIPVCQIFGMVDLHAGIPFECRVGYVVLNASRESAHISMTMVLLTRIQNINHVYRGA
jgi:hypothetical protein